MNLLRDSTRSQVANETVSTLEWDIFLHVKFFQDLSFAGYNFSRKISCLVSTSKFNICLSENFPKNY